MQRGRVRRGSQRRAGIYPLPFVGFKLFSFQKPTETHKHTSGFQTEEGGGGYWDFPPPEILKFAVIIASTATIGSIPYNQEVSQGKIFAFFTDLFLSVKILVHETIFTSLIMGIGSEFTKIKSQKLKWMSFRENFTPRNSLAIRYLQTSELNLTFLVLKYVQDFLKIQQVH